MPSPIHYTLGTCSLGTLLVARSEQGLCAVMLGDTPADVLAELHASFPDDMLQEASEDGIDLWARVRDHVEAPLQAPRETWTLDLRGTPFQQQVWAALRRIPAGQTVSYRRLAEMVDAPRAVRAVAGACAANRLAVLVPCHRVRRQDGGLSGYRWGAARKQALLAREGLAAA